MHQRVAHDHRNPAVRRSRWHDGCVREDRAEQIERLLLPTPDAAGGCQYSGAGQLRT